MPRHGQYHSDQDMNDKNKPLIQQQQREYSDPAFATTDDEAASLRMIEEEMASRRPEQTYRPPAFQMSESHKRGLKQLGCIAFLVSIVLFANSFAVIEVNQYGLLYNAYTGKVDLTRVYPSGRYFVALRHWFVTFPACQVNLEFSNSTNADAPPILARTGKPPGSDAGSGGQSLQVSIALQYRIPQAHVADLYMQFGSDYSDVLLKLARQAISDVLQTFFPTQFWSERQVIAQNLTAVLNQTMFNVAHITVEAVQLLEVDFSDPFELSIENIQLQIQQVQTNLALQSVQEVLNLIDIMRATANANITGINAEAQAAAQVITAQATAKGILLEQQAKAQAFKSIQQSLNLSPTELMTFIQTRAVREHQGNQLVVGVSGQPAGPSV